MKNKLLLLALCGFALLVPTAIYPVAIAQETIVAADAAKYEGEEVSVCGTVASATYASSSKGQPTFLDLDQPYPDQIFTVVIWGSDRERFSEPPQIMYHGKDICVTGLVELYRGKPEIIVHTPGQVVVKGAQ